MNGNGNGQQANQGLIGQTLNWLKHPFYSPYNDPVNWGAGVLGVVILSLLWSKVVRQVLDV